MADENLNKTDPELEQFILQLLKDDSLKPIEKIKKIVAWKKEHKQLVYSALEKLPADTSPIFVNGYLRLELAEAQGHWEDVTNEPL